MALVRMELGWSYQDMLAMTLDDFFAYADMAEELFKTKKVKVSKLCQK